MHSKKKEQEQVYDTRTNTAIQNTQTVSPLEARLNAQAQKYFDWEDQTGAYAGKPRDILDAPGMRDIYDVYGNAHRLANAQQHGMGALNLANPADGAHANQLKQLQENELYDVRAEGLNNALSGVRSQAYGLADNSIDRDWRRKQTLADMELQNRRDYYGRPKQPSIWGSILGAGAQIGAAAITHGGF